jgi:hypothetical protein
MPGNIGEEIDNIMAETDLRDVSKKLSDLEKRVERNEAHSRGRNLRINGIPFNKDMSLEEMVRKAIREGCQTLHGQAAH